MQPWQFTHLGFLEEIVHGDLDPIPTILFRVSSLIFHRTPMKHRQGSNLFVIHPISSLNFYESIE
jgi:hypothetical protein